MCEVFTVRFKQASIFICQQKWQATKKAIGSTMLAAHSKHNSKKNQLTPKKKYILATPHNHNITLINIEYRLSVMCRTWLSKCAVTYGTGSTDR